jgi:hypothetical protein
VEGRKMSDKKDNIHIPKLELEKFTFSPPGPMGWSFSEYEKILDDPKAIQDKRANETDFLQKTSNFQIIEFASNSEFSHAYKIKENKAAAVEHDETSSKSMKEEELELTKEVADTKEIFEESSVESFEELTHENPEEESSTMEEFLRPRIKIIIEDQPKKTPFLSSLIKTKMRSRM